MSGAQPKAATICGAVGVIAEVSETALDKRLEQGWVKEKITDLDECLNRMREAKKKGESTSIGFLGNVVLLWEALAKLAEETGELLVDLGSDQTSCHNPFNGGYYPVQLTFEEANDMMTQDPEKFKYVSSHFHRSYLDSDPCCTGSSSKKVFADTLRRSTP